MEGLRDRLLGRAEECICDARVDTISVFTRLRAAYDCAVFCALAFAESRNMPLLRDDPDEALSVLAKNVGMSLAADIRNLSVLHRRCDVENAELSHTLTDADATLGCELAERIQAAVSRQIREPAPLSSLAKPSRNEL